MTQHSVISKGRKKEEKVWISVFVCIADKWRGVGAVQWRVSAGGSGWSFLHHIHVSRGEDHQVWNMFKTCCFMGLRHLLTAKSNWQSSLISGSLTPKKTSAVGGQLFISRKYFLENLSYSGEVLISNQLHYRIYFTCTIVNVSAYFTGIRRTRNCQITWKRSFTVSPPSLDCWPSQQLITCNLINTSLEYRDQAGNLK